MKSIIAVSFLIVWCTANVLAECSAADKKALEAFDRAWSVAGQTGDRAKLMAIYADDYAGFPGMENKTSAINNTMQTFEENKANPSAVPQTEYGHYIVNCSPVSATVTHRNATKLANGSTVYSRSIHMLEKRGGNWVVVSNAGGPLNDAGTLWYLEQDWNNAVWKKDKAWFESNFASDYSGVSGTTGKLANKAQEVADNTDPGMTYDFVETTDMNIRVDGNTAIVTGVFHVRGKDAKNAAFDQRFRYTDVWIKRDGRWLAWASQGTLIK